jgi:hypothetical protein
MDFAEHGRLRASERSRTAECRARVNGRSAGRRTSLAWGAEEPVPTDANSIARRQTRGNSGPARASPQAPARNPIEQLEQREKI